MQETLMVEVRLLDEQDLKAFASGAIDVPTKEAIEAYLLHHPDAAGRVDDYRRAAERPQRQPLTTPLVSRV